MCPNENRWKGLLKHCVPMAILLVSLASSQAGNPTWVGGIDTPGSANSVVVRGDLAYVADGANGLQVINVGNPSACFLVGGYVTSGYTRDLKISGHYAYMAVDNVGLQVIDISNPTNCTLVGSNRFSGLVYGVDICSNRVFLANSTLGMQIVDVTDPPRPVFLGNYSTGGSMNSVVVRGTNAYVTSGLYLQIIDVSNPLACRRLGSYTFSTALNSLKIVEPYAYAADGTKGLEVINISNPASCVRVGGYNTTGTSYGVAINGTNAYVADGTSGLAAIDISNPALCSLMGTNNTPGQCVGVALGGTRVFVADQAGGLVVYDTDTAASPRIIQQPQNSTVVLGGACHFNVDVVDYVGEVQCQWLKNGTNLVDGAGMTGTATTSLVLSNVSFADAGDYSVIVGPATACVTSTVARLDVSSLALWGDNAVGQLNAAYAITNVFAAISAGAFHNLALDTNGNVFAWGKNADGQAVVPADATNIVAVAAGGDHSLALRNDGTVTGWGRNWDGQTAAPPGATNLVAIAAGMAHSVALRADGTVLAWGNNDFCQTLVSYLATEVKAIDAGDYHSLALRADGRVAQWGEHDPVPSSATNIVAIAAGAMHSLALRADGTVLAWGNNTYGQSTVPTGATNVVAIAAGYFHSLALRRDGTIVAWGRDAFGMISYPSSLTNVVALSAGEDHSVAAVSPAVPVIAPPRASTFARVGGMVQIATACFGQPPLRYQWFHNGEAVSDATNQCLVLSCVNIADAGDYVLIASNACGQATSRTASLVVQNQPDTVTSVGAWGNNDNGQCDVPSADTKRCAIAAGAFHALMLDVDGKVTGWGIDRDGKTTAPAEATNITAIAAGGDHSLALRNDGTVIAWGRNWSGQTNVPIEAGGAKAIAAGYAHSLALGSNGIVMAWGDNEYGQTNVPSFLKDVVAVSSKYFHNLALRSDGSVVAWGLLNTVPASATNVVAVAAGWWHSLALRADGSVIAWGNNSYGETNVPASATNITAIAAGYGFSLALRNDGTVIAWGKNCCLETTIPDGLGNVAAIAAGEDFSVALVNLGPPQFLNHPQSISVCRNASAFFSGAVAGTRPISFQWSHEGNTLAGANGFALQISGIQASNAGVYRLVASNSIGTMESQPATLTVSEASPFIERQPASASAWNGGGFALEVVAGGMRPLSYQWRLNGTNLPNAVSNVYAATAYPESAGLYSVTVSNASGGVISSNATLSVLDRASDLTRAFNGSGLAWASGDMPWFAQSEVTHDGIEAAQSGWILDGQETWVEATLTGPGYLSWWWKVSSETNRDLLEFLVDGVLPFPSAFYGISGERGWKYLSNNIPAGVHVVRWSYSKDESLSVGQDRAWLDEVYFLPPQPTVNLQMDGGVPVLLLSGAIGRQYVIEHAPAMPATGSNAWQTLTTVTLTSSPYTVVDITYTNVLQRYYRTRLEMQAP